MSLNETWTATLFIGGKVTREQFNRIRENLAEDCLDSTNMKCNKRETFEIVNFIALNGEFQNTEQLLVEEGIEFDRISEAYCDFPLEQVRFRRGMKSPLCFYEICPTVPTNSAKKVYKILRSIPLDLEKGNPIQKKIDSCVKILGKHLDEKMIPALKPFVILPPKKKGD